jgi:hypothetical protein
MSVACKRLFRRERMAELYLLDLDGSTQQALVARVENKRI